MKAKAILVEILILSVLCGLALGQWSEPVPVTEVNSEYADWTPFLSFDGLSLYFARGRTSGYYYFRIFEATRQQPYGPFTSVSQVLSSTNQHLFSPWVSQDNLRMYYFAQTENPILWQLKVSERASVNNPWTHGSDISELNQLGRVYAPKLTADELIIFFCSPDIPGEGGYDIWMATRPDMNSPFSGVRNLTEINTAANEVCPSVSPDGLTLLFQSNYSGDWQLFKATRGSLTEPFGNIEHLSVFDMPGYTAQHPSLNSDGSALYFTRLLGIDKSTGDIYVSYTPYLAALTRIENAIAEKLDALDKINAALEKEWTAYDALQELLDSGDYGDLKKGDIVTAMQKVYSAIQHEELAIKTLDRSIEKLLYSLSTLGYGPQPPGSNWPPKVTITQPEDGTKFNPDDTIEIEAAVMDFDGFVVMVEFFTNGNKIAEDTDGADGWTTSWSDHPEGSYSLTAQATDNEGATTTSPAVEITVFVPPPPPPPPPWPPWPPPLPPAP